MIRTKMHLEFSKFIVGLIGAAGSLAGVRLADALPADTKVLWEGGAYIAFVSFLVYAVRHLNAEVRRQQDLREKDREKMEGQWRAEHEANRSNREQLAESLNRLSEAVKQFMERK